METRICESRTHHDDKIERSIPPENMSLKWIDGAWVCANQSADGGLSQDVRARDREARLRPRHSLCQALAGGRTPPVERISARCDSIRVTTCRRTHSAFKSHPSFSFVT
eukprot:3030132-Rhodomonas_salina.4